MGVLKCFSGLKVGAYNLARTQFQIVRLCKQSKKFVSVSDTSAVHLID